MTTVTINLNRALRWLNTGMRRFLLLTLPLLMLFGGVTYTPLVLAQHGNELILGIQPILGEEQTKQAFQPLADYIAKVTGKPCVIHTRPNFLAYWDTLRKGEDYDLVLDAAHFTDYGIKKLGYTVLVKVPGTVSYTLIVSDQNPIFDPAELVAKRIATLGTPSIGAARLNALFPNPARQPITIEVNSAEVGMRMLLAHTVDAAILPTPIVSQQMALGGITVVTTTDPIPHIALSASPSVSAVDRAALRRALLAANKTVDGKAMLRKIGFEKFDPASAAIYAGQADILKEYWGF